MAHSSELRMPGAACHHAHEHTRSVGLLEVTWEVLVHHVKSIKVAARLIELGA